MDSPGHRANILKRSFREIGVGVVLGVPVLGRGAAPPTRWTSGCAASLAASDGRQSDPSAPSTTTSTASAACSPSSRRRTTSSTPRSAPSCSPARRTTSSRSTCRSPAATRTPTPPRCSSSGSATACSSATTSRRCGRSSRTTPGPTAQRRTRHGFFARVKVEDYGPGRIRPHERTHPGPKEDRLRLTRATHANLSPIFSPLRRPRRGGVGRARAAPARPSRGARSPTRTAPSTGCGASPTRRALDAVARRARARRAADRRRPPPLRDRARVPRGGRRRPRAHVPGRAPGPGPDRLPHPPPAHRASTTPTASRCAPRSSATSRSSPSTDELEPTGRRTGAAWATSTPTTAAR